MINEIKKELNYKRTENDAMAHLSSLNAVLDLFALGAAYRGRCEEEVIELFRKAFQENEELAMKCLFWIRDVRGGAGERRFFRVCMKWLAKVHPDAAMRNLKHIPEYGRYDDLYVFVGTPLEEEAMEMFAKQLLADMVMEFPSLAAKWAKSCNTSSAESRRLGEITRSYLHMTHREYRRMLSKLRERLHVLERIMSGKRFDEIDFSKIPSKAGILYTNCFSTRDELRDRYAEFMAKDENKVNANVLYPYEVVHKAVNYYSFDGESIRNAINKYWENMPDIFEGKPCSMLCVCDTSSSMRGSKPNAPINVAIGLSMYCAERLEGPFKNHYISFSSRPQLIDCSIGEDFVERADLIFRTNLCENTNLRAVFDLLRNIALKPGFDKNTMPKTICVISDMEIDEGTRSADWYKTNSDDSQLVWTKLNSQSEMENIRAEWESLGLEMPRLVYWNVDARNDTILDLGPDVSLVSGASTNVFKSVVTGKNGIELMLDAIDSERYAPIH